MILYLGNSIEHGKVVSDGNENWWIIVRSKIDSNKTDDRLYRLGMGTKTSRFRELIVQKHILHLIQN